MDAGKEDESGGRQPGEEGGGEEGGGRCVLAELTTNSARDKCLRPRTKERRGKINEKERETASKEQPDVESAKQILRKT